MRQPTLLRTTLLALLCAAAACATGTTSGTAAPPTALDSLSLERGACYGTCEIFEFVVRRNGGVTVRKQAGESNVAISLNEARGLLASAADAGVLTLPLRIRADSSLCPLDASDHSTVILTAYTVSGMRRIEHYTGCYVSHDLRVAPPLERLVNLERRIEALVVSKTRG